MDRERVGSAKAFGFMCGFPSLSRHDSELIIIHANAMSHIYLLFVSNGKYDYM